MDYKDYYQILGVSKSADDKEIKRAYRRLARQHHPDKNPNNKLAEEKFKQINEAYEVLGNSDNRQKYDQLGHNYHRYQQMGGRPGDFDFSQYFNQGGPRGGYQYQTNVNLNDLFGDGRNGGFSDFFQSIFGSEFGQRNAPRNMDAEEPITITLEEAYQGTDRSFSQGGKQFTAIIPPGVVDGAKIRLRGKGNQGPNGRGDLYLVVQIQPHPTFTVDGVNLKTTAEVDVVTAVLGGKVTVSTLSGDVQLTVPAGTQGGQTFRLRGKGMPALQKKDKIGDLFATIKIRIPAQLTTEQRQLYQELAQLT
ncbi:MAG: J domain-containing protein [Chloroflexi bacterium]|nr:J domain-containing protein [Chloroflexota bacterium]